MKNLSYTLELLVKGKPITEYTHENEFFVEGRKGSEYEVKITNNSHRRILAIPSVDGLNVITGKPASSTDTGYVIPGYQSVTIPGWTLDKAEVAKFTFSANDRSYSAQSGQGESNLGIIGVRVFNERYVPPPVVLTPYWNDGFIPKGLDWSAVGMGSSTAGNPLDGLARDFCSNSDEMVFASAAPMASASPMKNSVLRSASVQSQNYVVPVEESIGTAFGRATEFATTSTSFDREATPAATLLIRYDTRKGLEQRGIRIDKPKRSHAKPAPQAFPGDACTPPVGWKR